MSEISSVMKSPERRLPDILSSIRSVEGRTGKISFFNLDSIIGRCLGQTGEWCWNEIELFSMFIDSTRNVVDCGANLGHHTLALHELTTQVVFAFEPSPTNLILLSLNTQSNISNGRVCISSLALSPIAGPITIGRIDTSLSANYGGPSTNHGGDICLGMPLDLLGIENLGFIKIDVEGAELGVLAGAQKTLMRDRPIIFVEADNKSEFPEVFNMLFKLRYDCYFVHLDAYRSDNVLSGPDPFSGGGYSRNLLCFPVEEGRQVSGLRKAQAATDWWLEGEITVLSEVHLGAHSGQT